MEEIKLETNFVISTPVDEHFIINETTDLPGD